MSHAVSKTLPLKMTILILRVQRHLCKSILTQEFVFTGIFTRSTHYVGAGSPVYCPVNWRLSWPAFNIGKCNFLCFISQLVRLLCLINFAIPFTLLPRSLADKADKRLGAHSTVRPAKINVSFPAYLIDWLIDWFFKKLMITAEIARTEETPSSGERSGTRGRGSLVCVLAGKSERERTYPPLFGVKITNSQGYLLPKIAVIFFFLLLGARISSDGCVTRLLNWLSTGNLSKGPQTVGSTDSLGNDVPREKTLRP